MFWNVIGSPSRNLIIQTRFGIGIDSFHLGRDWDGIRFEVENLVGTETGSGFDRDPEFVYIVRGKKLLCEIWPNFFENHNYLSKKFIRTSGRDEIGIYKNNTRDQDWKNI